MTPKNMTYSLGITGMSSFLVLVVCQTVKTQSDTWICSCPHGVWPKNSDIKSITKYFWSMYEIVRIRAVVGLFIENIQTM